MTTPTPLEVMQTAAAAATGGNGNGQPAQQPPSGSGTPPAQTPTDPDAPSISQSHMNHLLATQKRDIQAKYADYDDKAAAAEKYNSLVAASRSAEEQAADLNGRLATRERDVADRDATIMRYRLAGAAQLPADLWDMVGGTDETSINANIEKLKRHMAPAAAPQPPQQTRPAPTPGQGRPPANGDGKPSGSVSGGRDLFNKSRKSSTKSD